MRSVPPRAPCEVFFGEIVILLCGGDKSTQPEDIAKAKYLASLPLEELKLED